MPRSLQSLIGYPKKEKSLWKIQALAGLQSQPPHTAPLITFSMERRRSWLIRSRVILFARDLAGFSTDEEIRTALDAFAFQPWLSFFAPDDLETNMTQIGFDQIEHFGSEEATERYLLDRTDGLTLPGFFRMIKARVA
jgi:hypothetical protein